MCRIVGDRAAFAGQLAGQLPGLPAGAFEGMPSATPSKAQVPGTPSKAQWVKVP